MKKVVLITLSIFAFLGAFAQAPNQMSYQAVVRNASGNLVSSSSVGVRMSILQGSASGNVVFSETHTANTNTNGLLTIAIGTGTVGTGNFSTIDWASGPYFIKTETDPAGGTNYTISGVTQIMSVPYALYAEKAGNMPTNVSDLTNDAGYITSEVDGSISNELQTLSIAGNTISLTNGGSVNLPAFTETDGSITNELQTLSLTADSLKISNGNTISLASLRDTLSLIKDNDSDTKIQVEETADEDIIRFDVAGQEKWMMLENRLEPVNTGGSLFIGLDAGASDNLNDNYNIFIGDSSGSKNTTGYANLGIGWSTLNSGTSSVFNLAIGGMALGGPSLDGDQNIAIGAFSMAENTTGELNVAIGILSMGSNTTGGYSTSLGNYSLTNNTTGIANTALGYHNMAHNETGEYNTSVGGWALHNNVSGNNNIALGYAAGYSALGNGNVFLGYNAGYNELGSNKLYIANSNTSTPLILGNFATKKVTVNDSLQSKYFRLTNGATNGYILKTDASGNASWVNPTTLFGVQNKLQDADADTKIQTEETADEDKIRFDLAGTERWVMTGKRLEAKNTGFSIFIGDNAGMSEDGNDRYNVAIGSSVLELTTTGHENVAIGYRNMAANSTGRSNTSIGFQAMESNTTGYYNVAIGSYALGSNLTGIYNTAVGFQSLVANNGANNVGLGIGTLFSNTTGSNNVAIGADAGSNNSSGSGNVFIGTAAGANETGSYKLYIDNGSTSTPLIYGDFLDNTITINGTFTTNGAAGFKFKNGQVAGTNNPDASATIWRFSSGTGTITLPNANTCTDRTYVITNNTGAVRTISTYRDAAAANQTTIANNTTIWLVSDGSQWWQIK